MTEKSRTLGDAVRRDMCRTLTGDDRARANAYPIIDNGVPTNYVIDRAGVVRYAKTGAFEVDELDALVRPLLNEPVPPDMTTAPTAH